MLIVYYLVGDLRLETRMESLLRSYSLDIGIRAIATGTLMKELVLQRTDGLSVGLKRYHTLSSEPILEHMIGYFGVV